MTSRIQALPQIDFTDLQIRGLLEIKSVHPSALCGAEGEQLMPSDICKQQSSEPKERTMHIKLKCCCFSLFFFLFFYFILILLTS